MTFTTLRVMPRWAGLLVLVAALATLMYAAPIHFGAVRCERFYRQCGSH